MRIVVILLLLANLALFALTRLDAAGGGEPQRLAEQIQPEKLKLLTPQQVAALGPKAAAASEVCVEWGPMSETERARAMVELAPLNLGASITPRRVAARSTGAQQTLIVLRDPSPSVMAKLRELVPAFAGTEVRVGGCERAPS